METNEEMRHAENDILEPLTAYDNHYKSAFRKDCELYFDGLLQKSGIDLEENRRTAGEYQAQIGLVRESERKLARHGHYKRLLIFAIVLCVLCLLVSIILFALLYITPGIILCVFGGLFVPTAAIVLAKIVLPRIRALRTLRNEQQKVADTILKRAWRQMAPLNDLFDDHVTKKLIEKTVPFLRLDDYFHMRRYDYLCGKYGYRAHSDGDTSTVGLLSGEMIGNPFVADRVLIHTMGTFTYTGSIVISWETEEVDSEGHTYTEYHTETLTASITRPKPYYREETRLVYGNEAAPDLHFSRRPSHSECLSDKARSAAVQRGVKKIRKLQNKSIAEGGHFTEIGNEEFDVLFGALDRDNEVQFRLLFTPLAQKNLLALMKDKSGYGDDFYMRKNGCLNYIISEHAAQWKIEEDRARYRSYSADLARESFLSYNETYFRSLYFDLAPLLSIPLYQQYKPSAYSYRDEYPRNFTEQETELAVNSVERDAFAPDHADTECILKTEFLRKDGESDVVRVKAKSYTAVPRVEIVPVMGGDGDFHDVPVDWIEYIPVHAEHVAEIKNIGLSAREFESEATRGKYRIAMEKHGKLAYGYHRGILCCVVTKDTADFDRDFSI